MSHQPDITARIRRQLNTFLSIDIPPGPKFLPMYYIINLQKVSCCYWFKLVVVFSLVIIDGEVMMIFNDNNDLVLPVLLSLFPFHTAYLSLLRVVLFLFAYFLCSTIRIFQHLALCTLLPTERTVLYGFSNTVRFLITTGIRNKLCLVL